MALPQIKGGDQTMQLMQTKWASELNPLLAKPLNKSLILKDVVLINGVNTINHLLGRKPQGWIITDVDAVASIFRSQPFNDLTLTLTTNADCIVTLMVY